MSKSAQSSLGYESHVFLALGSMPQSKRILLSGVVSNIQDLPTWLNPPKLFRVIFDA